MKTQTMHENKNKFITTEDFNLSVTGHMLDIEKMMFERFLKIAKFEFKIKYTMAYGAKAPVVNSCEFLVTGTTSITKN